MFEFVLQATDGPARAGTWRLPQGEVRTPCFMPVGTQGTVRALSPRDLEACGASLVLANTLGDQQGLDGLLVVEARVIGTDGNRKSLHKVDGAWIVC